MAIEVKKHYLVALLYFTIAATAGLLLRLYPLFSITTPYRFLVHTHSHIALLGWAYLSLTTLIYATYLNTPLTQKKYTYLFWYTQATLVGMLISFPVQGYAFFSILFSTLFLLASYGFFWLFYKNADAKERATPAYKCIKAGLWYMALSSLGPWALGAIMNTLGPTSIWYRLAIYFYLHFQYNGWMMMALLGLFLFIAQKQGYQLNLIAFKKAFILLNLAIILSFFLSTLFTEPHFSFYVLGGIGAILQLLIFSWGIQWWYNKSKAQQNKTWSFLGKALTIIVLFKLLLQWASSFPFVARVVSTHLDFTIGYLHLVFLGVISIGIFILAKSLLGNSIPKHISDLYFVGFFLSEALIFYRGLGAWMTLPLSDYHSHLVAVASGLIVIALFLILYKNRGAFYKN